MYTDGVIEAPARDVGLSSAEESVPWHRRSVLGVSAGAGVALAVIFVVALGLRLGWVWWTETEIPPLSDPQYYHATASNLADGRGYSVAVDERGFVAGEGSEATAFWAPGYSFALAPLYAAFGAEERWAKAFNAVVGALTVVPVFLLGRALGTGAKRNGRMSEPDPELVHRAELKLRRYWDFERSHVVGLIAAVLFALCPALIFWTPALFSEALFTFVVACTLAVAWLAGERRVWWGWVVAGVVLAATAFVRSQGMVLVVPVMVLVPLFVRTADAKQRRTAAGANPDWSACGEMGGNLRPHKIPRCGRNDGIVSFGLAFACVIFGIALLVVPWAIRNERAMEEPYLINDNLGYNLRLAHAPYSTGTSIAPRDLWDERPGISFRERELWWDEVGAARAWEYARSHPGREAELAVKRVGWLLRSDASAAMWWSESLGQTPVEGPRDALVFIGDVYWYGLLLVAAASLVLVRRSLLWWALWSTLGLWMGLHLVFAGEPRYHVPVVPVLCVLAAGVVVAAADRRRRGDDLAGGDS